MAAWEGWMASLVPGKTRDRAHCQQYCSVRLGWGLGHRPTDSHIPGGYTMTFYAFFVFPLPSQTRTFSVPLSLLREEKDPCMPRPQEGYAGMETHIA